MNRAIEAFELNMSNHLTMKKTSPEPRRESLPKFLPQDRLMVPSVIFVPVEVQPLNRWSPEGSCSDDCCLSKGCTCQEDEKEQLNSLLFTQWPLNSAHFSSAEVSATSVATREELGESTCDLSSQQTRASRRMSQGSRSCQRSVHRRTKQLSPPSLPRRQRSSGSLELEDDNSFLLR